MSWTAPTVDRREPGCSTTERESLQTWLDYHRQTLLSKCAGLTGEQLCVRAVDPSAMSLLGLVRHMALVERWWFRVRLLGEALDELYPDEDDEDADFNATDPAQAEADFSTFAQEVDLARAAAATREIDDTFTHARAPGGILNLRWVYTHMIEEYARHNGHADLLRECLDGATGE